MILDTNALSDFFDGDARLKAALTDVTTISLPVIVLGEYRCGLLNSRLRKATEPALDNLESTSNLLCVDADTVKPYSKLCDHLNRAGKRIPINDLWIAALAVQHGLPIVSRDKHFDRVPGVRRIGW